MKALQTNKQFVVFLLITKGHHSDRECNFDPNYLNSARIDNTTRPAEVMYWTHQNVKQWLSSNYFAEYTPALTESGIHGALIVSSDHLLSLFVSFLFSVVRLFVCLFSVAFVCLFV